MEEIAKDLRIQISAIDVLQEAAEAYPEEFFKDSQHFVIYGKRTAVSYYDMNLVQRIRGQRF